MKTRLIEATQKLGEGPNWGKFLVGQMDTEYLHKSAVDPGQRLLSACGWHSPDMLLVMDLQTKEGAVFVPCGSARADLNERRIWVCPLFEPFLVWLYAYVKEHGPDLGKLPDVVELPDAPFGLYGHRRPGMRPEQ